MKKILYIILLVAFIHISVILKYGFIDSLKKADAIIILGNKIELSGIPSNRLEERLKKGIEIYNNGFAERIIVSGGIGKEGFDEAKVMKEYLIENKIPKDIIIEDNKGYTTFDTANNIRYLKLDSVIIVSSYYHIFRTKLSMKKMGIENIYHGSSKNLEIRDMYSIIREIIGYYYYLLK